MHRQELRRRWGKHRDTFRNRTEIARFHTLTKPDEPWRYVDDATWSDLDMNAVFDRVDNTTTAIGRQYLYRQLHVYESDESKLRRQYHLATFFLTNDDVRELTQLNMWRLRSANASSVTEMLFGQMPQGNFPRLTAWILAGCSLFAIALVFLNPAFWWLLLGTVIANFFFSQIFEDQIGKHSVSFGYLRQLLIVSHRLAKMEKQAEFEQFMYLQKHKKYIAKLRSEFRIVGLDSTSENLIVCQIAYIMNLVCLFDFVIFMRCSTKLNHHKQQLCELYEVVASIDSAVSLGSYISAIDYHCCPSFVDGMQIKFDSVVHPLIEKPIPNNYSCDKNSCLVTGSNMAGKSTFIKTIGVNMILGQTIWICHAKAAEISKLPIASSIKREDSIEDGKSTYFAEIEALKYLIERQNSEREHVFLIDEILHGTNTIERIACSVAILEAIAKNNIVLVTSHDVELAQLLPDSYRFFHFRETADLENMFDYKIRKGHSNTRNAIKLLDAIGFPKQVIAQARRVVEDIEHS